MPFRYFKHLFSLWSTIIFTVVDIIAFIVSSTVPGVTLYPWVYWLIAGIGFVIANVQLYARLENKLKEYELTDPNLVLTILGSDIEIEETEPNIFIGDFAPWDGLDDHGMPVSTILHIDVEIENFGKEAGVFEWEIDSIELGNLFKLNTSEGRSGNFENFSGVVNGRDRYSGRLIFYLQPTKPKMTEFAKLLEDPDQYRVEFHYWTKKIGSKSKPKSEVIAGSYANYGSRIFSKWKKRGWRGHA